MDRKHVGRKTLEICLGWKFWRGKANHVIFHDRQAEAELIVIIKILRFDSSNLMLPTNMQARMKSGRHHRSSSTTIEVPVVRTRMGRLRRFDDSTWPRCRLKPQNNKSMKGYKMKRRDSKQPTTSNVTVQATRLVDTTLPIKSPHRPFLSHSPPPLHHLSSSSSPSPASFHKHASPVSPLARISLQASYPSSVHG